MVIVRRTIGKTLLMLVLGALLASCTLALPGELLAAPTPTFTHRPDEPSTETPPPSETPSLTPTIPSPTFTFTPTVLGGLRTREATATPTEPPTVIQLVLGGPLTQTSFVKGFVSIILSEPEISWGDCEAPHEVTVTARVNEPAKVFNVTIFVRLESKTGGESTDFNPGILMDNHSNGTFSYLITAEEIHRYSNFPNAWIQLQFVSTDAGNEIVDRTRVFQQNLSLTRCQ